MKVKKLHLENFRIHKDSTLSFGDSTFIVIRGANFAGKSTIGQALSMCLTPTTTGLDSQGRGFISKIKRGATKAVITADLQTKHHLIQRTVTLNTNASGRTQRSICLNDANFKTARFDIELEKQRAALTVALNTDSFLRMDEKEQKNLLAALALPQRYDFAPFVVAEVETILGQGTINFSGEPFAVINQAYKLLFSERQIVNRQVKDFSIPEALPGPEGVDSTSLQQQLTDLRMKRRELGQERDQAVAKANKEEQDRIRAKERLQSALDSEGRRKTSIREKLLKEGQLAYLHKVAAGKEEQGKLKNEYDAISRVCEHCRSQLTSLEKIPRGAKTCPMCEQPVDPEKLKELGEKLAQGVRETDASLGVIEQKIKALGDVDDAIALIAKHEAALKELDALDEQAPERQRKLEAAQQEVPEPTLFDFAPYNESLGECDAEIERLSGLLRPVIVAEERRKEIEIKQAQFTSLKEKAMVLDGLVKYFDKDGVKAKLLGEYIGGFERRLNEVLSAWGYSCALSIEPYQFDVTTARKDVVPVRELSGAERVMFSLAFQCAVSRTANIGIVVIDEVAMLLPEIRPILNRKLYEMVRDGYLDQVIMLVADTSWQISNLPGTAFYMVEDGVVHPINDLHKEVVNERRTEERSIA